MAIGSPVRLVVVVTFGLTLDYSIVLDEVGF